MTQCDFYPVPSKNLIKLRTEDEEIHCLKKVGVAAGARESIRRDTATLATATDTELKESDPFALKGTKMSEQLRSRRPLIHYTTIL